MGWERKIIKKHFPQFIDKIDDIGDRAEMLGDAQIETWKQSIKNNLFKTILIIFMITILIILFIKWMWF